MTTLFFNANADVSSEHLSVSALAYITAGIWLPTALELEQIVEHVVACKCCQKTLEAFIAASRDDNQKENGAGIIVPSLLSKIAQLMREMDMQDDMSAYIEILEVQGREEADQQFPILAEHLKKCNACQFLLEQTRTLLRRAEDAGLIAPLT